MGIFLDMYSLWDFWTKETGLALKTSVFSTETTLGSVFHLLAYQNFHKPFYKMGNKQLVKEWKLRHYRYGYERREKGLSCKRADMTSKAASEGLHGKPTTNATTER